MVMNSALYNCKVMHKRLRPRERQFYYNIFMLSVDLDELPQLSHNSRIFSYNRWNIYSLCDSDYLKEPQPGLSIKKKLLSYLKGQGVEVKEISRISLLTMPRIFGYQFNPVSFYYLFDKDNKEIGSLAEVTNTYREKKLYLLKETDKKDWHELRSQKNFYVSPFSKIDDNFHFRLSPLNEKWSVNINDEDGEGVVLISTIRAQRSPLTDRELALHLLRFPLMTIRVMASIHWHALRMWLRKFPVSNKSNTAHQQIDVLRPHKSIQKKP